MTVKAKFLTAFSFYFSSFASKKITMQLIDTHAHLYVPEFDADRSEIIRTQVASRVCRTS